MRQYKRYATLLFLLILISATVFRFYDIGTESLWTDEAIAIQYAQEKSIQDMLSKIAVTEAAPPLYYVFLQFWIKLFGSTEFVVRSLSALFSIGSLFFLYIIVKEELDKKTAILSSLFFATSMIQTVYSQEARLYSMFTLITLFITYSFFKFIKNPDKLLHNLLYILSFTVALYTNYLALCLPIFFTFIMIFKEVKISKEWIYINILPLIFSIPLLPLVSSQFVSINTGLSAHLIARGVPKIAAQLGLFFFTLPVLFVILSLFVVYIMKDRIELAVQKISKIKNIETYTVLLVALWTAFYLYISTHTFSIFGVNVIRSPITQSYFLIRHSLFLFPVVYVALAHILSQFKSKKLFTIAILLVLLTNIIALSTYYTNPTKSEWQEASKFLTEESEEQVIFLDKGGISNVYMLNYYVENLLIIQLTWTKGRTELFQMGENEITELAKEYDSFWLVVSKSPLEKNHYKTIFDKHFNKINSKEFFHIEVYKYEKNQNSA